MHILMRAADGKPTETTIIKTDQRPTLLERDPDQARSLIRELAAHLEGKDLETGLGNLDEDLDPDEPG